MTNSADREAVLAANQAFYDAFSHQDIKSMRLLWWQGTTSLCIHPGGRIITGWEEIQNSWASIFKHTDSLAIDIEIVKVEIDQALAYVIVGETLLQSSRGKKIKVQSIATNLFQNMAQKWYLVYHHGSPILR